MQTMLWPILVQFTQTESKITIESAFPKLTPLLLMEILYPLAKYLSLGSSTFDLLKRVVDTFSGQLTSAKDSLNASRFRVVE